ncbi:MAG TPA: TetR/AcrR family transcriptional regulator C-terminal domain-containing protein [Candidatus Limnocylindria bacterium]|jgi:AcrR family transcriptional regulator|nr:TetR/AcrR family transcriptional regulator C-terminal domain-containing protein [Candidatus Limnocylindria bacterium]
MAKMLASRRRPLTAERILDAAIDLIDRDGLEALSMRHLGAALGVEAMSLYRHFPSKHALLESVVGRLLAELVLPLPGSAPWQESFRVLARGYRALLLRHPNAIPLLATLQLSNPGALGAAGAVMAVLRDAGFDARTAFHVLATAESYVIGFAYWEAGTAGLREAGAAPPPLPHGADPYIVENWNEIANADCAVAFEFGLDVYVAGLERMRGA